MLEWIAESFGMLFNGFASLVSGAIRIGLVVLVIAIFVQYMRALKRNPIGYIRGTLGVVLMIFIGFGMPIFATRLLENPPEWSMLILWPLGWIIAYFVAKYVGGFSDENEHSRHSQAGGSND